MTISAGDEHSVLVVAASTPRSVRVRGLEVGGGREDNRIGDGGGGEEDIG